MSNRGTATVVKIGMIAFWNALKGFGFISVTNSDKSIERYHFLYGRIVAGVEPAFGRAVRFRIDPNERPSGSFRCTAYEVEIFEDQAALAAAILAGAEAGNAAMAESSQGVK